MLPEYGQISLYYILLDKYNLSRRIVEIKEVFEIGWERHIVLYKCPRSQILYL